MTYMHHHLSGKPPLDRHQIFLRKMVQKGLHPTMQFEKPLYYGKARVDSLYWQKLTPYQEHIGRSMWGASLYKKK